MLEASTPAAERTGAGGTVLRSSLRTSSRMPLPVCSRKMTHSSPLTDGSILSRVPSPTETPLRSSPPVNSSAPTMIGLL